MRIRLLAIILLLGLGAPLLAAENEIDHKLLREGRAEADIIWRRGFTSDDPAVNERLQARLQQLVDSCAIDPAITLKVRLFRSPAPNAFCLPDGSIYVFQGLLARLNSWDQVAFVVGHEARHAIGWHAQRRLAQARSRVAIYQVLSLGTTIALGAAGNSGAWLYDSFAQLGLGLATSSMISGYGRALESEADRESCRMLRRAGYDPCLSLSALTLIIRTDEEEGRLANIFWGSHPLLRDRIADLEEYLGTACPEDTLIAADYRACKERMLLESAGLWLDHSDYEEALKSCDGYERIAGPHPLIATVRGFCYAHADDPDSLTMAEESFRAALALADTDTFRLPWRGLADVAIARADTATAISCLEAYLADGVQVPGRRACQRRIQALREGLTVYGTEPEADKPRRPKPVGNWRGFQS